MGRTQSVTECRKADEFVRVIERQGGRVESGGRHYKVHDADGHGCVAIPRHTGDIPTGTCHSIVKALLALGFLALPLVCAIVYLYDYCAKSGKLP